MTQDNHDLATCQNTSHAHQSAQGFSCNAVNSRGILQHRNLVMVALDCQHSRGNHAKENHQPCENPSSDTCWQEDKGLRCMQASKLPPAVDRAWEKIGGGPADLYFPEEFLGVWNVESTLTSIKLPLGPDYVPDLKVESTP